MGRTTVAETRIKILKRIGWEHDEKSAHMISPDEGVRISLSELMAWDEDEWAGWCKGKTDDGD